MSKKQCGIEFRFTEEGPEFLKMTGSTNLLYGGLLFVACHVIEASGDDPEDIAKMFYHGIKECTISKGLKVKFNGEDEIGWM